MKALLFGLSLFAISSVSLTSCKKEKKTDCLSAVKAYQDAATAYDDDGNEANCKAYKAAMQNYLNSDCVNDINADLKASLQKAMNDLTCN